MMESVVFSLRMQTAPSASLMFTKSLLNIILLIALFLLYVLSTVNSAASKVFSFCIFYVWSESETVSF